MELQWPLIIFTTFIAWSAGIFATQGFCALNGTAKKSQMPALVTGLIVMVIGGIAVFTHLQHWERIFNGFGHITSGITQELIGIVLVVVVAFLFFVFMRRSEDGASVPKWCAVLMIAMPVVLDVVMAHSYLMAGRPAWNTMLWVVFILGNSCVLGPATVAIISAVRHEQPIEILGLANLVGSAVNLFAALLYYAFLFTMADGGFAKVQYFFDPTNPPLDVTANTTSVTSIMGANSVAIVLLGIVIGAVVPVIAAFVGRKSTEKNSWAIWGSLIVVCAMIGALVGRVTFYLCGLSVFQLF